LDKLNLVKLRYGGKVFEPIFTLLPQLLLKMTLASKSRKKDYLDFLFVIIKWEKFILRFDSLKIEKSLGSTSTKFVMDLVD